MEDVRTQLRRAIDHDSLRDTVWVDLALAVLIVLATVLLAVLTLG